MKYELIMKLSSLNPWHLCTVHSMLSGAVHILRPTQSMFQICRPSVQLMNQHLVQAIDHIMTPMY